DSSGHVNGIDQLFGDNTLGPDGSFAANGFLALAKYDANGDGVINANDPIFSQLRVWVDANHDGIAQPEELHPLSDYRIYQINLNYDNQFKETDQYGNQIIDKSLALDRDGEPHFIFDLWFVLSGAQN